MYQSECMTILPEAVWRVLFRPNADSKKIKELHKITE